MLPQNQAPRSTSKILFSNGVPHASDNTQQEDDSSSDTDHHDIDINKIKIKKSKPWGRLIRVAPTVPTHPAVINLRNYSFSVGRQRDKSLSDLGLNDSRVSAMHFRLKYDAGIVSIVDLSTNGTFVNDHMIDKSIEFFLEHEDVITLCQRPPRIIYKVEIFTTDYRKRKYQRLADETSELSKEHGLSSFYLSSEHSDLILAMRLEDNLEDVEIPVHRIVVCPHSPVFDAMLKQPCIESSEGKIVITDVDIDVMKAVLCWLYKRKLTLHRPKSDNSIQSLDFNDHHHHHHSQERDHRSRARKRQRTKEFSSEADQKTNNPPSSNSSNSSNSSYQSLAPQMTYREFIEIKDEDDEDIVANGNGNDCLPVHSAPSASTSSSRHPFPRSASSPASTATSNEQKSDRCDIEFVFQILATADRYGITTLAEICSFILCRDVTTENAGELGLLVHSVKGNIAIVPGMKDIWAECLETIISDFPAFRKTPTFNEVFNNIEMRTEILDQFLSRLKDPNRKNNIGEG